MRKKPRPPLRSKKANKGAPNASGIGAPKPAQLILFNKPYGVLTQFRATEGVPTLAQYIQIPNIYPAGRLDKDSEGLLALTDSGWLQHRIAHPKHKAPKTYWVQVDGEITDAAIQALRKGVALKDGMTLPCKARRLGDPNVWARTPPVRFRQNIPTSWLEIVLREGRNRQVRRMTAAVGFPTLRLVRVAIGQWQLGSLRPGEYRAVTVERQ